MHVVCPPAGCLGAGVNAEIIDFVSARGLTSLIDTTRVTH